MVFATSLLLAAVSCSCEQAVLYSSSEVHVSAIAGGDPLIYFAGVDRVTGAVEVERIDPTSGETTTVRELPDAVVLDLAADDYQLYLLVYAGGASQLIAISKTGPATNTLARTASNVTRIFVDENDVYWVNPSSSIVDGFAVASLQRVSKFGGPVQTVSTSRGLIVPEIAMDNLDVFYAATPDASQLTYTVFAVGKYDQAVRALGTFFRVTAIAIEGDRLYIATDTSIVTTSKSSAGAVMIAAGASMKRMRVLGGRIYALESRSAARGCADDLLVSYDENGRFAFLSDRGGDFIPTPCGVIHIPTDCFPFQQGPPFTVERLCLPEEQSRRHAANRQ